MPQVTLPSDQGEALTSHFQRTERLERRTSAPPATAFETMVFSYPGVLATNIESPPWYPSRIGSIQTVRVSLLANASTTHTIEVRVGGVAIQQFSLAIGSKTAVTACAIPVSGTYVTIKTITVADSDLTVSMEFG